MRINRYVFIVTQGCGNCSNPDKTECIICKIGHYCNTEDKVHKHCWTDKNKICKTKFNDACYTWRTPTNEVKKGCGKCPFHTCEECEGHRCNIETKPPFYCFGFMGGYNKCNKSDCYIAKIEVKNEGVFFILIDFETSVSSIFYESGLF
uniref:Uncharacterized protein n=1 Tax=Meloidogyne enterolobii TaxID=390850 RepID=A0A6V7XVI9_MELEN|nr:unnamed protein product [Meloidogyne enterolobii]CAD2202635.1 unnamed protein product [Meloidogyne enterolobii]CAD2203380.1 unnamed protein product [Meloidogyne enterolobii]